MNSVISLAVTRLGGVSAGLSLLLLTGCAFRYSAVEEQPADPSGEPVLFVQAHGSSRALERKAQELMNELSGDEAKDHILWQQIFTIRDMLVARGYFTERKFVLPNVRAGTPLEDELQAKMKTFGRRTASPVALVGIGPADGGLHRNAPIRVTVLDKKSNEGRWEKLFKELDKDVTVEQEH